MMQMSDELGELKNLRQKFEKFEHSYVQNFKNSEGNIEVGEKTLNFEMTVNEEEYIKENSNNLNNILNPVNVSTNKNPEGGGISVILENDERNYSKIIDENEEISIK